MVNSVPAASADLLTQSFDDRQREIGIAKAYVARTQELFEAQGRNSKFIPITFSRADLKYIPTLLKGSTHYKLGEQYEGLYRLLTNQPETPMTKLGPIRNLRVLDPLPELPIQRDYDPAPTSSTSANRPD